MAWQDDELTRLRKYRSLIGGGVDDLKNNDFIVNTAKDNRLSTAADGRNDARETRNLLRYGAGDVTAAAQHQRGVNRNLSDSLNTVDSLNRAYVQQYDADKQFANQLIGIGHGVGSTADDMRNSITAAKRQKEDAYSQAKSQTKNANAAAKQQTTTAVVSAIGMMAAAFM